MKANLEEIESFLVDHPAFGLLPADAVGALSQEIEVAQVAKGQVVVEPGQAVSSLYLVRSGAVDITAPDGQALMQLGEGEAFGVRALLGDGIAPNRVAALEDAELYRLPKAEFARLKAAYPEVADFFVPMESDAVPSDRPDAAPGAAAGADERFSLMSGRLATLMTGDPVTIARGRSIRDAAGQMREHGISCMPVMDQGSLVGIVTNRDLRDRVVAEGLDVDRPVEAVMTPDPIAIDLASPVLDALLVMTQRNISHLPVTEEGRLVGIVTHTNLVRRQTRSAVYLVGDIAQRHSAEALAQVVAQVPRLLADLVDSGAAAHSIGHIVTSICDAITRRLLALAEAKLGPPPVPYVWLACGSQGRQEQTGVSDQDNCLVLDDAFDAESHGDYFRALARFVCDGLDACGYVHCPGEMMAMTDRWRQPLRTWRKYFTAWIEEPAPMAQMLTSVLFDLRPIWGEARLCDSLLAFAAGKAQSNSIFIAHLVSNALTHTPPLGFFRNFVLIRGGEHKHHFDMKHSGVVPIIDIARVYSLKAGSTEVGTRRRLEAARDGQVLSESGAQDLIEAFEFISITRLKHQAKQIRGGEQPDNFLAPSVLSHFERSHLKDAFNIVKTIQSSMANTHQTGGR